MTNIIIFINMIGARMTNRTVRLQKKPSPMMLVRRLQHKPMRYCAYYQ